MSSSRKSADAAGKKSSQKQPSKRIIVTTTVLVICVMAVLTSGLWGNTNAANWAKGFFVEDGKVMDGTLELEGVESTENVPEGEVRFYINKNVVFENPYTQGSIIIQNPEKCGFILQFRFYVVDEFGQGSLVYISDKIKPGQYIKGDKLDSRLFEGTYNGTYTVFAYSPDNPDKVVGETSGFLKIMVEN